jgi:hypothetical protein
MLSQPPASPSLSVPTFDDEQVPVVANDEYVRTKLGGAA